MTSFDQWVQFYLTYFRPVIDILILTYILYKIYGIIEKTHAVQLLKGALLVLSIYAIANALQLSMLLWILNMLAPGLLIGVAIIFQPELRKIFLKLGQVRPFTYMQKNKHSHIDPVLTAAEVLSSQRRGMLVVFMRHTELNDIAETGTRVNAELSSSLLITIFGHDTPMHDGAVLVQDGKVIAAGCFLPLSEQQNIRKTFGTRHRAALGMSEQTDAVVLVVSEESGAISLAYDSKLYYDLPMDVLYSTLEAELDLKSETNSSKDERYEKNSVN